MTSRRAPRGILLDLDGTIADSIEFFYGLACEMVQAANCAAPERAAEGAIYLDWFSRHGYRVVRAPEHVNEGEDECPQQECRHENRSDQC